MPTRASKTARAERAVMGWREWIALPDLAVPAIKVKVDTGARSSAIHAYDMRVFKRRGVEWVAFTLHPLQRSTRNAVEVEAPVIDWRNVRNSGGKVTRRPVIETTFVWNGHEWPIELGLVSRDEMGFRMLLGRQSIKGRNVVDPARSFVGEHPMLKRAKKKPPARSAPARAPGTPRAAAPVRGEISPRRPPKGGDLK